jgi:CBS domain-containing protein
MSTVRDILASKGDRVLAIGPHATVLEAARLMNREKVGALVVHEQDRAVGMFTERDVLMRIVAEQRDPAAVTVGQAMTQPVACCRPDTTVEEARTVMRNRRIRHLPVVDEQQRLLGLISIGDLNAWRLDGQEKTIYFLSEYIYGRV